MTTTLEVSGTQARAGIGGTPHVPLASVCDIIMGQAPAGDTYNTLGNGVALIAGAGDFSGGILAPKKFTDKPTKLSKPGDIVLSIRASIGDKVWADQVYCLGRGVAALRAKPSIDSKYLWHWLSASRQALMGKAKGATFLQVNRSDIGELLIAVPSLDEQRRIAVILDKADELRTKRRQAVAQVDFLTQSIFHNMFGTFSDASLPWPRVPIGEACSAIVDCVNRTAPLADGPTPYKMIRTSNIRNREIDISNVRYVSRETFDVWNRRATPQRGDIVLTREAPMGEAGQISFDDEVFLGQRMMLYRPNPERLSAAYLLYYLTSSYMKRDFERHGTGTTVKHLSVPYCRSISIHLPPIELQLEFARRIAATERVRENQRSQLAELDVLFAALQHRAFTGDL